ncbi:MAG: hypothetical protein Q9174_003823 [Haloplaca sp. 1 TL-2023]
MAPESVMKVFLGDGPYYMQCPPSTQTSESGAWILIREASRVEKLVEMESLSPAKETPQQQSCHDVISTPELRATVQHVQNLKGAEARADEHQGDEAAKSFQENNVVATEGLSRDMRILLSTLSTLSKPASQQTPANELDAVKSPAASNTQGSLPDEQLFFIDLTPTPFNTNSHGSSISNETPETTPPPNNRKRSLSSSSEPFSKKKASFLSDPGFDILDHCSEEVQSLTKEIEKKSAFCRKADVLVERLKAAINDCDTEAEKESWEEPLSRARAWKENSKLLLRIAEVQLQIIESDEKCEWQRQDNMLQMWD